MSVSKDTGLLPLSIIKFSINIFLEKLLKCASENTSYFKKRGEKIFNEQYSNFCPSFFSAKIFFQLFFFKYHLTC